MWRRRLIVAILLTSRCVVVSACGLPSSFILPLSSATSTTATARTKYATAAAARIINTSMSPASMRTSRQWGTNNDSDNCDTSDSNNRGTKRQKSSSNTRSNSKKHPTLISKQSLTSAQRQSNSRSSQQEEQDDKQQLQQQRAYNELLPKYGYSLADTLEKSSDIELFETILTPMIITGKSIYGNRKWNDDANGNNNDYGEQQQKQQQQQHDGIARIDTISNYGGREPVRWVVSLGDRRHRHHHQGNADHDDGDATSESYVMIDLPPYSDKLADEIRCFMDPECRNTTTTTTTTTENKSKRRTRTRARSRETATLDAILLTNQQCIHYDSSPGVYVTRKSDLTKWKKAFPEAKVVMYRLDIPRECREEVTQVLDGYGPWGWKESEGREEEESDSNDDDKSITARTFVETGRPLTIQEWDEDTKSRVLKKGELPPDDKGSLNNDGKSSASDEKEDDDDPMYSQEAIRQREEQYRLLAVYTPGHTFGSVTYIFPKRNICCSGFSLPLESSNSIMDDSDDDDDDDNNIGRSRSGSIPPIGPRLDYQGYLATSASRPRQMSSALSLINNYIDRFRVVLPARGDIVFLDSDEEKRKRDLMESVGLYRKISDIYGRLGIE